MTEQEFRKMKSRLGKSVLNITQVDVKELLAEIDRLRAKVDLFERVERMAKKQGFQIDAYTLGEKRIRVGVGHPDFGYDMIEGYTFIEALTQALDKAEEGEK